MQVVSGPIGRQRVHFEAPAAERLDKEMGLFLDWFNVPVSIDEVLFAAQAHLWFVTIHPFDDGNGRIARAIADMALARSEHSPKRFYSMSAQIQLERNEYYKILERTQKGGLEITPWMQWFLDCLDRAFLGADTTLASVLRKARFWEEPQERRSTNASGRSLAGCSMGFEGKLTSTKWAKLAKCSQDTAGRDIADLVGQGILVKDPAGGRSTSYSLVEPVGRPERYRVGDRVGSGGGDGCEEGMHFRGAKGDSDVRLRGCDGRSRRSRTGTVAEGVQEQEQEAGDVPLAVGLFVAMEMSTIPGPSCWILRVNRVSG